MTQTFNFTTNIEKRMPTTGEVYFVDRMTSGYAVQHPFDVDGYLEQVYQKWQDCETIGFRETREALHRQWDATLGCRNPRGNASIYPNKNGEKHPALMEAWLKAGDYWRRGLRLGDVLPAVVPPCKITRTEDGWIALFPKDLHLLTAEDDLSSKEIRSQGETESCQNDCEKMTDDSQKVEKLTGISQNEEKMTENDCEHTENDCKMTGDDKKMTENVVELDMFDQMQQELETLREENRRLRAEHDGGTIAPAIEPSGNQPSRRSVSGCSSAVPAAEPSGNQPSRRSVSGCSSAAPAAESSPRLSSAERRRQRQEREAQRQQAEAGRLAREAAEQEKADREQQQRKVFAAVGAVAVTLLMIHFFGLLGPAFFGLIAGGLLKG